jgi:ribosomal protein S18 acetylase RimI-like enzyme
MSAAEQAVLDNPVYASLGGTHARFAEVRGRVRRYSPDVAPFLGMPAAPSAQDWRDAAELIGQGSYVAVPQRADQIPDGWRALDTFDLVQMIGEQVTGADCAEALALGAADVPEMLELVAETEPGPFLARTIELGDYLGIRRDGALVAMAGERFHPPGWAEISAVCTKPTHRGSGLASGLMAALIARIERRSERPFLHVLASNSTAIRLYEDLGFAVRQRLTITVATPGPRPAAQA